MSQTADSFVWINLHVEMSSFAGAKVDDYVSVPRAEWEAMSEDEQERWIQDSVDEHLANTVSAGGGVIDVDTVPAEYLAPATGHKQ